MTKTVHIFAKIVSSLQSLRSGTIQWLRVNLIYVD